MINIVLACQYGASTDLLAVKMQEAAKKENAEVSINAYSYTKLEQVIDQADIVLLGPQIRFKQKSLEKQFADKKAKFMVINPSDYGMLNGEGVLKQVLTELKK
jgi:PTS system cellobiose-specific IIB component